MSETTSDKTKPISISMPPAILERLDAEAARTDIPRSTLVRHLLDAALPGGRNSRHRPWFEVTYDSTLPPRCTARITPGVAGWAGPAMSWVTGPGEAGVNFRNRITAEMREAGIHLVGATVLISTHPAWDSWGGHVPKHLRAAP
ncbi:ribbon-helix-helix protein, CopG family [Acidiphilium sp.]|uniref:ribbon-helix-helix protein, CopG family n=1 Tax=Acidiphilium sp. TaxID=527 RepID=UPI003CFDE03A